MDYHAAARQARQRFRDRAPGKRPSRREETPPACRTGGRREHEHPGVGEGAREDVDIAGRAGDALAGRGAHAASAVARRVRGRAADTVGFARGDRAGTSPSSATSTATTQMQWLQAFAAMVRATAPRIVMPCDDRVAANAAGRRARPAGRDAAGPRASAGRARPVIAGRTRTLPNKRQQDAAAACRRSAGDPRARLSCRLRGRRGARLRGSIPAIRWSSSATIERGYGVSICADRERASTLP